MEFKLIEQANLRNRTSGACPAFISSDFKVVDDKVLSIEEMQSNRRTRRDNGKIVIRANTQDSSLIKKLCCNTDVPESRRNIVDKNEGHRMVLIACNIEDVVANIGWGNIYISNIKELQAYLPTTRPMASVVAIPQQYRKHYDGVLGEFDYDSRYFRLMTDTGFFYLKYIGSDDGRNVVIPPQIRSCRDMFRDCHVLRYAPKIPKLVDDCSSMFLGCINLEEAPEIPNSVRDCTAMFRDCVNLRKLPLIPNSVMNIDYMFAGCKSVTEGTKIPALESIVGLYSTCTNLLKAPEIPNGVLYCNGLFANCGSLQEAPKIPDSVANCAGMFMNCYNLRTAPNIPSHIIWGDHMFLNCRSLEKAPVVPEHLHYHDDMFTGCISLSKPVVFNK